MGTEKSKLQLVTKKTEQEVMKLFLKGDFKPNNGIFLTSRDIYNEVVRKYGEKTRRLKSVEYSEFEKMINDGRVRKWSMCFDTSFK